MSGVDVEMPQRQEVSDGSQPALSQPDPLTGMQVIPSPQLDEAPVSAEPPQPGTILEQTKAALTSSYLNALYVFVPLALLSSWTSMRPAIVFVLSFLALIPLAAALGDFTEDLAKKTNDVIGALINVTFGNATELIISIAALRYGEFDLIRQSLVGSVLGNMLLVLGSAFVVGGLKSSTLKFNVASAQTYMASLLLASFGFLIPTAFFTLNPEVDSNPHFAVQVSREVSLLMVVIYGLYLYFQLKTHKHIFDTPGDDEDDDDDGNKFTFWFAVTAIAVIAVLISLLSDFLVDTVTPAAQSLHISKHFIGLVLIPIIGNVAEHASAIIMAAKLKLDISLGIALGSSIQIGMFVMPLLCVIGWFTGKNLSMDVTPFISSTLFGAVLLTFSVVSNGTANWLTGGKLLASYLMLCVAFLHAE